MGRIKIFNISLDIAAVLPAAVITGHLISRSYNTIALELIDSYMDIFSSLGTALFVSVIGLSAGYSLNANAKANMSSVMVGIVMAITPFVAVCILSNMETGISHSSLLGVLCGALTTTPGLSSVCEKTEIVAEEAVLGYGSSYFLGVIITVTAVQLIMRKEKITQTEIRNSIRAKNTTGDLLQISTVIVLGKILGGLSVPCINFSLGTSGGILCVGIMVGYIAERFFDHKSIAKDQQGIIRNLGLAMFFVGNGIPVGMGIVNNFSLKFVMVGVALTIISISTGLIICKCVLRKSNFDISAIIAGGMTSTPAAGVLLAKYDIDYSKYSFAYIGALIMNIVLLRAS